MARMSRSSKNRFFLCHLYSSVHVILRALSICCVLLNFQFFLQIASLKAALARKEGEPEHIQTSISGSSEKYRTKASEISPFQSKQKDVGLFVDHNICRQPMGDVGNIEVNKVP